MANVDIIIRSIDQTKGNMAKVGKETNTFANSLKTAATNAAVVTAAVAIATQSYDKLITKTQQYNQEVYDMMLTTKGTAEETSKLIQVVDDTGVSYETLKNAMKLAIKNGVEPNIEGIAKLSDEYNNLKDPVKQGQLLMDKFGKSGLEMGRVMVLGGDALRKMSADMKGGLVATQANIEASESYRKTLDNLEDTIKGLTVTAGNELIPVLDDALKVVTADIEGFGSFVDIFKQLDNIMKIYPPGAERAARATTLFADAAADAINSNLPSFMEDTSKKTDSAANSYIAMARAMDIASEASDEIVRANDDQLSIIFQLSAAYKENAEAHAERTKKILLDMTLEKIAMLDGEKGFSDAEMAKALAVAETAGAVEAAAIRELVAMEGLSGAIANGTIAAKDMKSILESITAHGWTVQVAIQMQNLENLRDVLAANQAANPNRTYNIGGREHASGGDFLIPMSYGNEGFQMGNGDTASGGERVSITPKGQVGQPSAPQLTERGIAKAIVGEMLKHGMGSMGR